MKKDLKHLDLMAKKLSKLSEEYDLTDLLKKIADERLKIVEGIGKNK